MLLLRDGLLLKIQLLFFLSHSIPIGLGASLYIRSDWNQSFRMLGWKAKVSLEEGVQQMLDRLEDWRDAPVWNPETIQQATSKWFQCLGDKVTNV